MSLRKFAHRLRQGHPAAPALLPPGRTVAVPGRGDFFVRDSGPETARRGTVLLLHGWMFNGETNWSHTYGPLVEAGYRTISVDHRGHGKGLRGWKPFRLLDCAFDAAAIVRELRAEPVVAVGYSMGGAIAQLMAAAHPQLLEGVVLSGTFMELRDHWRDRAIWRSMGLLQLYLRLAPRRLAIWLTHHVYPDDEHSATWLIGELERSSPYDVAEAGRELGRFDARDWIAHLRVPLAVVCTARDRLVPPRRQREIAVAVPGTPVFEIDGDHSAPILDSDLFTSALLEAIESVRRRASRLPLEATSTPGRVRAAG
jgi:pimeloyl-ACP methyl ester carboxylesterase